MEWRPNPRQELALTCPYPEIGFGGARGGGKTEGGIAWMTHDTEHADLRGLVLRKDYDDLKDWIDRAEEFFYPLGVKRRDNDFYWPSGAIIRTGHYHLDKSFQKYLGQGYQRILIEELNLIPREENYLKLMGSLRTKDPVRLPAQIMSNFNPSEAGFYWIKKRFKLQGVPREPVVTKDERTGMMRVFIQSKLEDNFALAEDKNYVKWLDSLPDGLREAWRDGSWDEPQIEGGVYTSELLQMRNEIRLRLCPINKALPVHTAWDIGVGDATAIIFFQKTKLETTIVNYYENQNFGLPHYAAYLDEWQRANQIRYGKHYAPFDVKNKEWATGMTRKQTAEKIGVKFEDVPKVEPTAGIEKVRLMFPHLYISEPYCQQLISALKNYRKVYDEKMLMFKQEAIHDWASHGADALRYMAVIEGDVMNEVKEHYIQKPRDKWSPNVVGGDPERQASRRRATEDEMGNPIGNQGGYKYW